TVVLLAQLFLEFQGVGGSFIFEPPSLTSTSLDHLVGAQQDRGRDIEAKRLGGLEIDRQHDLCRKLDWQIASLGTFQSFINIVGGPLEVCRNINAVAH